MDSENSVTPPYPVVAFGGFHRRVERRFARFPSPIDVPIVRFMLFSGTKRLIKRCAHSLGLEIRRVSPEAAPPECVSDPHEAMHRIRSGERVALDARLSKCVMFNGFSLGPHAWHPLHTAAREYLDGHEEFEGSVLERYFALWQPAHALEALIGAKGGPDVLKNWPAHLIHVPWLEGSPAERTKGLERILRAENSQFGEPTLSVGDGYGLQGPVSKRKGLMEHRRLVNLVHSIKRDGYRRSLGDPRAQLLVRGGELRIRVSHGHHRVAVLAALRYERVAIVPTMLIDREDAEHWPQVYKGIWTCDQALAYFDHHFDFDSFVWAREHGLVARPANPK